MASNSGKLSNLSQPTRFITSHDDKGKAIAHSAQEFQWQPYDNSNMAFSVLYTTSQSPANLNSEADIKTHDTLMDKGNVGLVNKGGSVLRAVDFAPGYKCAMHRTQSIDYGIVMEGSIDMVLDSGEVHHMKKGDVAVQRATQHQWINTSQTEWARMMFVLQDCQPLFVGGEKFGEDLGHHGDLPSSNN